VTESSPPPLRLLFWETTSRCNLACLHCRRCDVADELSRSDLTAEQAEGFMADLAAMGKPILVFSGGEPLMRPDWPRMARRAAALGLPTALATNGTLVDDPTAELIREVGFRRVSVSLDGADADTHDAFRSLAGSFDKAVAGCRRLVAAGVDLQINCTIASHNAGQLDALYDLARSLDATALHLFGLVPVGCGVEIADSHRITPAQYETFLHWAADREQAGPLQLKVTCAPHYFRVKAQRQASAAAATPPSSPMHSATRGCLAGISVAFISHRGDVFGCGYLPVAAGTLDQRGRGFDRIWRESPLLAELRDYDRLTGACGRCRFKTICGGCRARAYNATGDYLSEEPMCDYTPA